MNRFKKILVYASTETGKYHALRRAEKLAATSGARLKVVDVVPDIPLLHSRFNPPPWILPSAIADKKKEVLEKQVAKARQAGIEIEVEILFGKPFVEIIREVLRNGHELVMKTVHQRGLLQLADSTAMELLRNCPCPVELVRPSRARRQRVLACVDPVPGDAGREQVNAKIMHLANSFAIWEKADLHVVYAWNAFGEGPLSGHTGLHRKELDSYIAEQKTLHRDRMQDFLGGLGVELSRKSIHIVKGDPAVAIPRIVKQKVIDLVVMGTVARSGISGLLIGNTAEKVVNKLEASLVTVKPDGFVSPVKLD
jgi:nucleotide-binding universal stress UspA family protein